MPILEDQAKLHEKTVQEIATGLTIKKERKKKGKPKNGPVTVLQLHPMIMEYLEEHDINMKYVQTLNAEEVIIRNQPGPWS